MKKNEILISYGTEYKTMTKRLLTKALLVFDIENKNLGKAARICIKPNLVTASPAKFGATTHTEIVAGIIEYLKENGFNNLFIAEGSWVGDKTEEAFEYCGYNELSKQYGVPVIDTQKDGFYKADTLGLKMDLCNCTKNFDFLINVPVLKGHCQTKMTCALKNMKGLIPNSEKRRFHAEGLHEPIAKLNTLIHQDFIVIDDICGDPDFEEGGNPSKKDCIMAAKDPVLVDSYAARELGYESEEIEYIGLAEKYGVGSADLENAQIIKIEGRELIRDDFVHKILSVNYAASEIDSCSACYGALIGALNRLKEEGLPDKPDEKICIGQGYEGKTGRLGVGNCTRLFEFNVPGCPPKEEEIYKFLKKHMHCIVTNALETKEV